VAHSYDQTLIQRMGFSDPDRKLPAHDDACVEIATDPERFIRAIKDRLGVRLAQCDLEVPLQKGDGKYASTVGFIDAMVMWGNAIVPSDDSCARKWSTYDDGEHSSSCKNEWDEVGKKWRRINCVCQMPWSGPLPIEWEYRSLLIEVKTHIDGIGNLLRQMNLYREYKKNHRILIDERQYEVPVFGYIIWSLDPADARFAKLLSQQGYTLIAGPLP